MKNRSLEDKLNVALNSLNHIEISDSALNKIDEMLQGLPPKGKVKPSKRRLKSSLVAAGVTMGLLGGFCITFPTYASNVPILNKIVGEKSIFGWDFGRPSQDFSDDLKDYSIYIGETRENNGLKVTIEELLFDGKEMYLAYSVEGEAIKGIEDLFKDIEKYPMPVRFDFNINGERPQGISWGIEGKKIKDDKIMCISNITLGEETKEIKEIYDINFKINSFADINGQWDFKFRISGDAINKKIRTYKGEKDKFRVRGGEGYVNNVVSTPVKTYVEIVEEIGKGRTIELLAFNSSYISLIDHNNEVINGSNNRMLAHNSDEKYFLQYMFEALNPEHKVNLKGAVLKEHIEKVNEGIQGKQGDEEYTKLKSDVYKNVLEEIQNKKTIKLSNIKGEFLESKDFGTIKLKSISNSKENLDNGYKSDYHSIEMDLEISGPMKEALAFEGMYVYNKKSNSYSKITGAKGKAIIINEIKGEKLNVEDLEVILIDLNEIYDMPKELNKEINFSS
ncbi:DUF4179 domain-containing protein [Clostridium hydrogeniformans]|uniref:DUF4179 domain-containing protein n=1 Tax=Clostridium hydrogeniformans TaxID=349933 RepID=UPI00047F8838|nr:DUF4179 domain-containing protein [Clostridium hydrogeniformans]